MRICIYTEDLRFPLDEGIKKVAYTLIDMLSKECNVLGLCKYGMNMENPLIRVIPTNRLLLCYRLKRKIKSFDPNIVLYIPSASMTFYSFLRLELLKFYAPNAKAVMLILQPRNLLKLQKKIIQVFLRPDLILASSNKICNYVRTFGCEAEFIPLGVDIQKFTPVSEKRKRELREKYEIPQDKFVILHVGHINYGRNLRTLIPLQRNNNQVIIVSSTSTPKDCPKDVVLQKELEMKGIIVMDRYIKKIEEIYQLSDCYVFPVTFEGGCISVPLSVLEAMACNLPVVTTKFGGLPAIFKEGEGFIFININSQEEIKSKINIARITHALKTREMVEQYTWDKVLEKIRGIFNEILKKTEYGAFSNP